MSQIIHVMSNDFKKNLPYDLPSVLKYFEGYK